MSPIDNKPELVYPGSPWTGIADIEDPRTISGLTAEISHLRVAVEALADRVRKQEERIRSLER